MKTLPDLSDDMRYTLRQLPQEIRHFQENPVQLSMRLMQYSLEIKGASMNEKERIAYISLVDAAQALLVGADFFRAEIER